MDSVFLTHLFYTLLCNIILGPVPEDLSDEIRSHFIFYNADLYLLFFF